MKQADVPGYEGKYFVNSDGEIYRRGKRKNRRLYGHRLKSNWIVKLTDRQGVSKDYSYSRIVYQTLVRPIPTGYVIAHKNGVISDNRLINLKLTSRSEIGKKTGPRSRSKAVELLDNNGRVIDSWASARKAGKALFISRQTVSDICNKKIKNKLVNLRWERA